MIQSLFWEIREQTGLQAYSVMSGCKHVTAEGTIIETILTLTVSASLTLVLFPTVVHVCLYNLPVGLKPRVTAILMICLHRSSEPQIIQREMLQQKIFGKNTPKFKKEISLPSSFGNICGDVCDW